MQSYSSQLPDYSADNSIDYGRRSTERPARTRRSGTARSAASRKATGYGGLHRRRNKQWSW